MYCFYSVGTKEILDKPLFNNIPQIFKNVKCQPNLSLWREDQSPENLVAQKHEF